MTGNDRTSATGEAKVLVVDDEENIRYLVATALEIAGFQIAVADNGQEAVEVASTFRPDVVVLDIMLPDIDGFTVMRRMRDMGSQAAVIFLTARDNVEDRVRGLTTGGADYQTKPFAIAELVARVRLRAQSPDRRDSNILRCADLELDADAHVVTREGGARDPVAHRVQAPSLPSREHGQGADPNADPRPCVVIRLRR